VLYHERTNTRGPSEAATDDFDVPKKNKFVHKKEFAEIEMGSKKNLQTNLIEEIDDVNSIQELNMRKDNSYTEGKINEGNIFERASDLQQENVTTQIEQLYNIIDSLNYDTDLDTLIDTVNNIRIKNNRQTFSKNDLNISFRSTEVDKFSQYKKMHKEFSVNLNFQFVTTDKKF